MCRVFSQSLTVGKRLSHPALCIEVPCHTCRFKWLIHVAVKSLPDFSVCRTCLACLQVAVFPACLRFSVFLTPPCDYGGGVHQVGTINYALHRG